MNFISFDFETTGFSSQKNEVIEFSFVKFKDSIVVDEFSSLVRPLNPIPANIIELTHITPEMVSSAPLIKDLALPISKFIENLPLFAYNARFDKGFLNVLFYRHNIHHHFNSYGCALKLVQLALKLSYMPKLAEALKLLNIIPASNNFHRANFDAVVTGQLIIKCCEILNWTEVELIAFTQPLKTVKEP